MNSRPSSRRPVIPPPDYSGVLFNNPTDDEQSENESVPEDAEPAMNREAQPQAPPKRRADEHRESVPLPLPAPELHGLDDCLPRFPLAYDRRYSPFDGQRNRRFPIKDSYPPEHGSSGFGQNFLANLLEHAEVDDLLLAALIIMMLECGADRFTILLLGVLLF